MFPVYHMKQIRINYEHAYLSKHTTLHTFISYLHPHTFTFTTENQHTDLIQLVTPSRKNLGNIKINCWPRTIYIY